MVTRRKRRFLSVVLVAVAFACVGSLPSRSIAAEGFGTRTNEALDVAVNASCLESAQKRLAEAVMLLGEARVRIVAAEAEHVRIDALRAVEGLESRIRMLAVELESCAGGEAAVRSARQEAPKGESEPRLEAKVDGDRALARNVRVDGGARVEGAGEVDEHAIRFAITRLAEPLERCYADLATKGAAPNGNAVLSFRVSDGQVDKVHVDLVRLGDAKFRSCIATAARTLAARAFGGEAVYRFRLGFGPSSSEPPPAPMYRSSEL